RTERQTPPIETTVYQTVPPEGSCFGSSYPRPAIRRSVAHHPFAPDREQPDCSECVECLCHRLVEGPASLPRTVDFYAYRSLQHMHHQRRAHRPVRLSRKCAQLPLDVAC